jgi:hypothetical protein
VRVAQQLRLRIVFRDFDDPSVDRLRPGLLERNERFPVIFVFGTMVVSTTRVHGRHFSDEKYSAASFSSASVIPLAS